MKISSILLPLLSVVAIALAAAALMNNPGTSAEQKHFQADTLYALGDLYMIENRPLSAIDVYEKAIKIDKRPAALTALGNAYLRARNYSAAEEILRKALNENAEDWDALFVLGNVHLADGKIIRAEQELKKVIEKVPTADNAYDALGTLYLNQNDYAKAEEIFRLSIGISPDNANLHNGLGVVYLKTGRKDAAVSEFQAALSLEPNHANARRNLQSADSNVSSAA